MTGLLVGIYVLFNKFSLTFVPKGPIDKNPVLVQIMAWHWIGDKQLSELMLTQSTAECMQH